LAEVPLNRTVDTKGAMGCADDTKLPPLLTLKKIVPIDKTP
jgi:hypothetical protein